MLGNSYFALDLEFSIDSPTELIVTKIFFVKLHKFRISRGVGTVGSVGARAPTLFKKPYYKNPFFAIF